MNILFWRKKKEVQEPRILHIPRDRVQAVLSRWDNYAQRINSNAKEEKYLLWDYIESILPETKSGGWTIIFVGATEIDIIEQLDKK